MLRRDHNAQVPDHHASRFAHAQKRDCVRSETSRGLLLVGPVGEGAGLFEKKGNDLAGNSRGG